MSSSSNSRRFSRYDAQPVRHGSTPTANYIVAPKTIVSPGTLTKNVNQKAPLQQQGVRLQPKESVKSTVRLAKANASVSPETPINPKSALIVSPSQGIFEIHVKHLALSDSGVKKIENFYEGEIPSLRISWKFLSFERSTIPLQYNGQKHIQIESSVLYKIDVNENFFEYIFSRSLSLELYGRAKGKETYLARGEVNLTDILEYPLNELFCYVDLCDIDKALVLSNTGIAVVYGSLTLWYRLSCDMDILNSFFIKAGHIYYSPSTTDAANKQGEKHRRSSVMQMLKNPEQRHLSMASRQTNLNFQFAPDSISEESESMNSLEPTESELESFQEALDLVLSRNKALRITQSEISNELRDRARWLHEESNWKRTLQEHAILSGKNPLDVQWRQWRTESTANVRLRNYQSQMTLYEPEVVITVECLKLYTSSPPIKNNTFKEFYIEYAFLTHEGVEMECPFSLPKLADGKKLVFNFTKRFSLDLKKNPEDCHKLAEVVKNAEDVVFVVVGEPASNLPELLCCQEVGSCVINMLELIELETNEINDALPVHDSADENIEIGYMKIRISGIQAMRRLALELLAPPGYTILE